MSYDPAVCVHKIDAMQVVQELVSHGYTWFGAGEVEADRALSFVNKMDELYGIGLDRNRRTRRAARGEANAQLVLYPKSDATTLRWWLLATDGTGEIHRREKLAPVTSSDRRIEWRGYELVRLTFKSRTKASWTWRMTADEFEGWLTRLERDAHRQNPVEFERGIYSLYRTPGFAGVRQQVGRLFKHARTEWKKAHSAEHFPPGPVRLFYLRKRKKEQQPLSMLVRRVARGNASWFGSAKRSVVVARS